MTYFQQRNATIQERFNQFHRKNPVVYNLIKNEALKMLANGARKISIKRIVNDVRWDKFIVTKEPTLFEPKGKSVKFKIDDAFTSRYNRLFINDYPQYEDRIEKRRLRSL